MKHTYGIGLIKIEDQINQKKQFKGAKIEIFYHFTIWGTKVYDNGTVVLRIIRKNPNVSTTDWTCFYEMLSLRIIYPNGTVIERDIKLEGVQQSSYCKWFYADFDNIGYELIRMDQILVTYLNKFNGTHNDAWG